MVISAMYALDNIKIDIVTSSELLAKRNSNSKGLFYKFYTTLSITCSHNIKQEEVIFESIKKGKDCYKCDIVYGDCHNF